MRADPHQLARILAALAARRAQEAQRLEARRTLCGAITRNGTPCRCMSEKGKRRCRFHGGKSTGPKTAEGRAKIAEAQRQRWAKYRSEQVSERRLARSAGGAGVE